MKLSVVVLTKNEEEMLGECLESVRQLADGTGEIIVVDDESTDRTVEIAKQYTDKVFSHKLSDFASQRNFGLEKATGDWILYLDADERVTPELKEELFQCFKTSKQYNAYKIPRKNILLGRWQKHGGWWPDYVHRLFKKETLKGWQGELHESPVFDGKEARLKNPLLHIAHRSIEAMLLKTAEWSEIEARLRLEAHHPKVNNLHLLKVGFVEFFRRFFKLAGFLDGKEGLFEASYQAISVMITYVRLWEMQQGFVKK